MYGIEQIRNKKTKTKLKLFPSVYIIFLFISGTDIWPLTENAFASASVSACVKKVCRWRVYLVARTVEP